MENISGRELLYKNGRFLIKKDFGLFFSFNWNTVNGSFIFGGSILMIIKLETSDIINQEIE